MSIEECCRLGNLILPSVSFNPYFVGDEYRRIKEDPNTGEKWGFNPYFVGDEYRRIIDALIVVKPLGFNPYFVGDEYRSWGGSDWLTLFYWFQSLFCWR